MYSLPPFPEIAVTSSTVQSITKTAAEINHAADLIESNSINNGSVSNEVVLKPTTVDSNISTAIVTGLSALLSPTDVSESFSGLPEGFVVDLLNISSVDLLDVIKAKTANSNLSDSAMLKQIQEIISLYKALNRFFAAYSKLRLGKSSNSAHAGLDFKAFNLTPVKEEGRAKISQDKKEKNSEKKRLSANRLPELITTTQKSALLHLFNARLLKLDVASLVAETIADKQTHYTDDQKHCNTVV